VKFSLAYPIKDHVDPLVCDCRVDDGAFSSLLDLDCHCAALILVRDEGSNVGLDTTGTETDDDDSCNVSSERMASFDRCGKCSRPENQQTDPVNSGEDQDCVVFAQVLISDDGTKDGCHCVIVSKLTFTFMGDTKPYHSRTTGRTS
jgi:hypothetical protein